MSFVMSLFFVILLGLSCSSHAHMFYVGDDEGWTLKSSEFYNRWAKRNRFQVKDELMFRYKKGHDSVLVVKEEDFQKCNKDSPVKALKDGDSKFKLERSGWFFFISGHEQNCEKGQKFILEVLHHHDHYHTTLQPPSPSPSPINQHSPRNVAPQSHSPSLSPAAAKSPKHGPTIKPPHSPHSLSPSPAAKTPKHSPTIESPHSNHSPSPSPVAKSPKHEPTVAPSHSHPPSPSATAKPPKHVPVEPPNSQSPSSASSAPAKTPSDHPIAPPRSHSPSPHHGIPSPRAAKSPAPASSAVVHGSYSYKLLDRV